MKNYRNEWLTACFSKSAKAESIKAYFNNGREADYTMNIFSDLTTDPTVKMIISNETGEILFER